MFFLTMKSDHRKVTSFFAHVSFFGMFDVHVS